MALKIVLAFIIYPLDKLEISTSEKYLLNRYILLSILIESSFKIHLLGNEN